MFHTQSVPKDKPSSPHEPSWNLQPLLPKDGAKHLCSEAGWAGSVRMSGAQLLGS